MDWSEVVGTEPDSEETKGFGVGAQSTQSLVAAMVVMIVRQAARSSQSVHTTWRRATVSGWRNEFKVRVPHFSTTMSIIR